MTVRSAVLLLLFAALAIPAAALPDQQVFRYYYDENGTQVGYAYAMCSGGLGQSGSITDSYTENYSACVPDAEPFSCGDMGLYTIGSCNGEEMNPTFCVSSSYKTSYEMDTVPDCQGKFVCEPTDPNPGNSNPCY